MPIDMDQVINAGKFVGRGAAKASKKGYSAYKSRGYPTPGGGGTSSTAEDDEETALMYSQPTTNFGFVDEQKKQELAALPPPPTRNVKISSVHDAARLASKYGSTVPRGPRGSPSVPAQPVVTPPQTGQPEQAAISSAPPAQPTSLQPHTPAEFSQYSEPPSQPLNQSPSLLPPYSAGGVPPAPPARQLSSPSVPNISSVPPQSLTPTTNEHGVTLAPAMTPIPASFAPPPRHQIAIANSKPPHLLPRRTPLAQALSTPLPAPPVLPPRRDCHSAVHIQMDNQGDEAPPPQYTEHDQASARNVEATASKPPKPARPAKPSKPTKPISKPTHAPLYQSVQQQSPSALAPVVGDDQIAKLRAGLRKTNLDKPHQKDNVSGANSTHPSLQSVELLTVKPSKPLKPAKPSKPLKPSTLTQKPPALTPSPPPPPPPPSRSRAPPPPPPRRHFSLGEAADRPPHQAPDVDLELQREWFAAPNQPLPKAFAGCALLSSYLLGGTYTLNVTFPDVSKATYNFTWPPGNPAAVKVDTEYTQSPLFDDFPTSTLIAWSNQFGEHVALWSERMIGKVVGRGECWDLAHDALEKGCGKHAFISNAKVHGYPILDVQINDQGQLVYANGRGQLDLIRRGDIIQMDTARFEMLDGSVKKGGFPDHTAVVVEQAEGVIDVLEQSQGVPVHDGTYNMKCMRAGRVTVYRPTPANWGRN